MFSCSFCDLNIPLPASLRFHHQGFSSWLSAVQARCLGGYIRGGSSRARGRCIRTHNLRLFKPAVRGAGLLVFSVR